MKNSKGSMVLGGVEKEAVKIYFQEKKKSRLKKMLGFHFGLMSILLLFSYLTGDYNLLLLGAIFSTITITADSATQFESGGAEYNRTARLDDNTFVIAFRDINDNNKGKVIIGTRSGTTISIVEDSAETFESGETSHISMDILDSTHFVIAYRDITDSNHPKVVACSISGVTITVGSIVELKNAGTSANHEHLCVTALDDTYFVVCYTHGSTTGVAKVGSVSGITITLGSEQSFSADAQGDLVSDKLTTTKIVVGYNLTAFNRLYARIGTIDTGAKTIAWGTALKIEDFAFNHLSISCFDDTYFIIAGYYSTSGYSIVCSVTGTTITKGSWVKFLDGTMAQYVSVCTMDSTHFVVSYKNVSNSKGYVRGGSISGTTITYDGDGVIIFENDATNYTSICKLMSNYFVVGFKHGA